MFPLSVPVRQLARLRPDAWVLDPFCGRGSTNFAARLLGLGSVGVDSNPVAAAIAEGKMVAATTEDIVGACSEILSSGIATEHPQGDFWALCYHPRTFDELCRVRAALMVDCSTAPRKALRALILGLLHGPRNKGQPSYLSNQTPRTYAAKPDYAVRFWTKRRLRLVYVSLVELVSRKASHYFDSAPPAVPFRVVCGDSRTLKLTAIGPRFSTVVTSPPYFGMRTYVPDQWLRAWFLGGPPGATYHRRGKGEDWTSNTVVADSRIQGHVPCGCVAGWPPGIAPRGLPQIRTCGFPASGSSEHGFARAPNMKTPQ